MKKKSVKKGKRQGKKLSLRNEKRHTEVLSKPNREIAKPKLAELSEDSELEEIIEEEINEEESEFLIPFTKSNANAPVLEKVAFVNEPLSLGGFFNSERKDGENADYKTGKEIDYSTERNDSTENWRQNQEDVRPYEPMIQDEKFRQTERIIENTGEKSLGLPRDNRWETQRTAGIDTEERRRTEKYMGRGDYK